MVSQQKKKNSKPETGFLLGPPQLHRVQMPESSSSPVALNVHGSKPPLTALNFHTTLTPCGVHTSSLVLSHGGIHYAWFLMRDIRTHL